MSKFTSGETRTWTSRATFVSATDFVNRPKIAKAYEQLKRQLATRDWADMNEYAEAKGPLIEAIVARADPEPGSIAVLLLGGY